MERNGLVKSSYWGGAVVVLLLIIATLGGGCSVTNNTATTRFYHNLTTRYNVYHNGKEAFDAAYRQQLQDAPDNLAARIYIEPIFATHPHGKEEQGGPFDPAIEKGQKAISLHSIRSKPKLSRNSRRSDPFYQKTEYNTFIHNAWILVGRSQFNNGDFLDAMATFSYMARLYREEHTIRDQARLWQARCYVALGWGEDARRILSELGSGSYATGLYGKVTAEEAILAGRYEEAIPKLEQAIRKERNKLLKTRLYFLKGQLEIASQRPNAARKSFSKVISSAAPFPIEVAARLNRVAIDAGSNPKEAIRTLERMLKRGRYSEVIDQVALAKGQLHLSLGDTIAASESLQLGAEKSKAKSFHYALCNIELARIALAQRNYIAAAKRLSSGIQALTENYPQYDELKLLSENLDELSRHAQIVYEQDSLRHLASLPEKERLAIIDSAITAYKKRLREEGREAQLAEQQASQEAFNQEMGIPQRTDQTISPTQQISDKSFYFYNKELIALGKTSFAKTWGNRPLEDDWRRKNKRHNLGSTSNLSPIATDTTSNHTGEETYSNEDTKRAEKETESQLPSNQDPSKRDYYLASLPFTVEAIASSDALIQGGLEGMGSILNERMERFGEAINTYEELLTRYPTYENRLSVYYTLYMLCERIGDTTSAKKWQRLMQEYFPQDPLSKAVAQPNYIARLRSQDSIHNKFYDEALAAYFEGSTTIAKELTDKLLQDNPETVLKAKALFLQGFLHVAEGDAEALQASLQQILDEIPGSDVAEVAEPILAELAKGRRIVKDSYQGIDFGQLFYTTSDSVAQDSLFFTQPVAGERYKLLLMYPHEGVNINELLFAVAAFNFSQFTEFNLKATQQQSTAYDLLTIEELPSLQQAREYLRKAYAPDGYMRLLEAIGWLLPISNRNHQTIQQGLALGEYINFLAEELIVFMPEAALPLEAIAHFATQDKEEANKNTQQVLEEKNQPVRLQGENSDNIQRDSTATTEKEPTLLPPPEKTAQAIEEKESEKEEVTELSTYEREEVTLKDVEQQRKERIAADKQRAKQAREEARKLEREKQKELREREKARKEREKQRAKELREREKARRKAQQEREKERRAKAKRSSSSRR